MTGGAPRSRAARPAPPVPKPVIYQLVVRYFGNTNLANRCDGTLAENGCGRFADINRAAVAGLADLGATHVWLTGIHRQATLTEHRDLGLGADSPDICKGRAGSFFAIRDYFDVCPDYACDRTRRLDEFRALVRRLHGAGLAALIDLVPNHVSRAYATADPAWSFGTGDDQTRFFARDNAFFYLAQPPGQRLVLPRPRHWSPAGAVFTGGFPPEDGGPGRTPRAGGDNTLSPRPAADSWYDTVKLNYGWDVLRRQGDYHPPPRTWLIVDRILAFWQGFGVDGFRCDFAHYIPGPAWTWLIARARARRAAYFLAEAYPRAGSGDPIEDPDELLQAGFDALYDAPSYEVLKLLYLGRAGIDRWTELIARTPHRDRLLTYLENHDERRLASPLVDTAGASGDTGFGSSRAGYQLAPLQLLHGRNPVLLFNGQEVGEAAAGATGFKGDDGRTTIYDYGAMPAFARWVNGHAYDGGTLDAEQRQLRAFYRSLLALCRDPAIALGRYRDLRPGNRWGDAPGASSWLVAFARWQPGAHRVLVVVANLRPGSWERGRIRLPAEVLADAGCATGPSLRLLLGAGEILAQGDAVSDGWELAIPDQRSLVLEAVG